MAKNRTRRNKTQGGDRKNKNKVEGGRRKTRGARKTKKASSWTMKVTELYKKMKKADNGVQFKDALVEASRLKKKGEL